MTRLVQENSNAKVSCSSCFGSIRRCCRCQDKGVRFRKVTASSATHGVLGSSSAYSKNVIPPSRAASGSADSQFVTVDGDLSLDLAPLDPRHIRHALRTDPLLAKLLPVCRTLESARNELRWLKESVSSRASQHRRDNQHQLKELITRRAKGEPLQYLLGTEYFGDLEIRCRPGVLIPRQDTAASVSYLVSRLVHRVRIDDGADGAKLSQHLRVLDLCTGSGCIPLLFHHEWYRARENQQTQLDIVGIDISPTALSLAAENHQVQLVGQTAKHDCSSERIQSLQRIQYIKTDIMSEGGPSQQIPSLSARLQQSAPDEQAFDVLISNPPYVSRAEFRTATAQSVRHFEPRLALVPSIDASANVVDGDQFYPRLWEIADRIGAKVVLFEVGDHKQAVRVVEMSRRHDWENVEIWRDDPRSTSADANQDELGMVASRIVGSGHSRSVFATRGQGMSWVGNAQA